MVLYELRFTKPRLLTVGVEGPAAQVRDGRQRGDLPYRRRSKLSAGPEGPPLSAFAVFPTLLLLGTIPCLTPLLTRFPGPGTKSSFPVPSWTSVCSPLPPSSCPPCPPMSTTSYRTILWGAQGVKVGSLGTSTCFKSCGTSYMSYLGGQDY